MDVVGIEDLVGPKTPAIEEECPVVAEKAQLGTERQEERPGCGRGDREQEQGSVLIA